MKGGKREINSGRESCRKAIWNSDDLKQKVSVEKDKREKKWPPGNKPISLDRYNKKMCASYRGCHDEH